MSDMLVVPVEKETRSHVSHKDLYILLGITGSVAAIKAPELICSLISTIGGNVHVKVVLTKGGSHFWEKASAYDATSWDKLQEYMMDPCRKQVEIYSKYEFIRVEVASWAVSIFNVLFLSVLLSI
jgi:Flavoprotein